MFILWIRRSKTVEWNGQQKNDKESLKKHDEETKRFDQSHHKIETTNQSDVMNLEGDILATVQHVRLNRQIQN